MQEQMNSSCPDKITIRQYLLGRLHDEPKLEESLSERMFYEDELSEMVDLIEDEIVEEYLDGTLPPADKQAVEEYFLRPPERRKKLQFARVLRQYFDSHSEASAETDLPAPSPAKQPPGTAGVVTVPSHARTWAELAAVVVLSSSCLIYFNHIRSGLLSNIADNRESLKQLEARLDQERQRSASLAEQLDAFVPHVTELPLNATRRAVEVPTFEIKPWIRKLKFKVRLGSSASPGLYRVALERSGQTIWPETDIQPSHDKDLIFEIPAQVISSGDYVLSVVSLDAERLHHLAPSFSGSSASPQHLPFHITVTK